MEATIILFSGERVNLSTWQGIYGLPVRSNKLGRFITMGERSVNDGLEISEGIIRLFDALRSKWGKPLVINSLDRTEEKQKAMQKTNPNAAKTSPHVVKLAMDIDTVSHEQTFQLLTYIKQAARELNYKIRIGWKSYMDRGNTFVHIDICPMYFGKGKIWHSKPHPAVWESVSEW